MDIPVWKITPRSFALSQGEIVCDLRLLILTERFTLFGLDKRYSVLFGLTDNLFIVIHENTSLVYDSIVEKADEASSGENDK